MIDDPLVWFFALAGVLLLAAISEAIRYLFPPRCDTCGRRYNHKAHAECPYCHPLRRPTVTNYAPVFVLCAALVGLGLLLSDGVIIGCGAALLFALVVGTQLGIPFDEVLSVRVLLIGLLCFGIVAGFASIFQGKVTP